MLTWEEVHVIPEESVNKRAHLKRIASMLQADVQIRCLENLGL